MAQSTTYWSCSINDDPNEFVFAYWWPLLNTNLNSKKIYGFLYSKITSAGFINIWQFDPSFEQFVEFFGHNVYKQKIIILSSSKIINMVSVTLSAISKKKIKFHPQGLLDTNSSCENFLGFRICNNKVYWGETIGNSSYFQSQDSW